MLTKEELKKLADKDLDIELTEAQSKLVKLGIALNARETKSVSELKTLRKYIARIKTFKHELELETKVEKTKAA